MTVRYATRHRIIMAAAVSSLVVGCAQTPLGPTVQVMPGPGKSFDAFSSDQSSCRIYAGDQVKGQAEAANNQAAGAALLTTMLGAGLGAAAGSGGRHPAAGQGAAYGASAGAATGAAIGADMSANAQIGIQQQYDNAFSQCMYAKGELVPGFAPLQTAPAMASSGGPDPALVRAVQGELARLGYYKDGADGAQGSHTRTAIRDFERSSGLPVDGSASPRLLAKLQATPTGQAATASAPSGWVAPASAGTASAGVVPASAPAPAAPSGWVSPTKTQ